MPLPRRLCPFPRLHPLWHKSRVDFDAPAAADFSGGFRHETEASLRRERDRACAAYNASRALATTVGPGDVLYVPPYWWHTVETLTHSLSLTTISRWPQLYIHLNAIYTHEFFFDKLRRREARGYALRAFVTTMLRRLAAPPGAKSGGDGSERAAVRSLLEQYVGLEHLFQRSEAATCVLDGRGTPTCGNCLANTNFDVTMVVDEHLLKLPAGVRAVVVPELIEELTQHALGTAAVLPFLRDCFDGQPFFLTKRGDAEHGRLWVEGGWTAGETTADENAAITASAAL